MFWSFIPVSIVKYLVIVNKFEPGFYQPIILQLLMLFIIPIQRWYRLDTKVLHILTEQLAMQ